MFTKVEPLLSIQYKITFIGICSPCYHYATYLVVGLTINVVVVVIDEFASFVEMFQYSHDVNAKQPKPQSFCKSTKNFWICKRKWGENIKKVPKYLELIEILRNFAPRK